MGLSCYHIGTSNASPKPHLLFISHSGGAGELKSVDKRGFSPKIDGLDSLRYIARRTGAGGLGLSMFAIVSDIHANLEAFQAVLADIHQSRVSRVICLGDVVGYGPNPRECLDLAMKFEFTIVGNHDQAVLYEPMNFNIGAERASYWTRKQLEDEPDDAKREARWTFLGSMQSRRRKGDMLFCHGSPRRPTNEYIFADDIYYSPSRITAMFEQVTGICFVGHSHVPGVFLSDPDFFTPEEMDDQYTYGKEKAIVNVGSVGQPRDRDPKASYVVVDESGKIVTFKRVAYDYETTMKKITAIDELDDFLARRLKVGQ